MRIRSNVVPTPIVSQAAPQPKAEHHAAPVQEPAPIKVDAGPVVIDLGDKQIQLEQGELAKVVEKLNQTALIFNYSLRFEMSEANHVVVRVVDIASGQVIREIPPDEMLDAFTRMEAALGLLLDVRL